MIGKRKCGWCGKEEKDSSVPQGCTCHDVCDECWKQYKKTNKHPVPIGWNK